MYLFVHGFIPPLQSHSMLVYSVKTLLRTGNNLNKWFKNSNNFEEKESNHTGFAYRAMKQGEHSVYRKKYR